MGDNVVARREGSWIDGADIFEDETNVLKPKACDGLSQRSQLGRGVIHTNESRVGTIIC